MKILIIFPNQLFEQILDKDFLSNYDTVVMHEYALYFTQYKFHKLKIKLHTDSMKDFKLNLEEIKGKYDLKFKIKYFHSDKNLENIFEEILNSENNLKKVNLKDIESNTLEYFDVVDNHLEKEIKKASQKYLLGVQMHESPMFYFSEAEARDLLLNKVEASKVKKILMKNFYERARNKTGILMHEAKKPMGGKYSFDADNREKYKGIYEIPDTKINYPINHKEARKLLTGFIDKKLNLFGKYEDAIVENQDILFHSKLSSSLNIGLITPHEVIHEVLKVKVTNQNIASIEGFVRQVIGWREFMRITYIVFGGKMRTANTLKSRNKMADSLYTSQSGLEIFDNSFSKLEKSSYNHHIERLMIFGNLFFMLSIDPDEVYEWFMMHYIDAYDWVMVGNVYAMSQYASDIMTSKPYFASSNYLLKMSDFKKTKAEGEWCEVFDILYWGTVNKHREILRKNIRLNMMVSMYDKFDQDKKDIIESRYKEILKKYTK